MNDKNTLKTTVTLKNLNPYTKYYIRTRTAYGNAGNTVSKNSPSINGFTNLIPPKNVSISLLSETEIDIKWNYDILVAKFNIAVSKTGLFNDDDEIFNFSAKASDRSKVIKGLESGTRYYLKISALINSLQSSPSKTVTITLPSGDKFSAPIVKLEALSPTSFKVNWNRNPAMDRYYLTVSTDKDMKKIIGFHNFQIIPSPSELKHTYIVDRSLTSPKKEYYVSLYGKNSTSEKLSEVYVTSVIILPER